MESLPAAGAAAKVTVLGLGLIGGSLAAALREIRTAWIVTGYDVDESAVRRALERGLVHAAAPTRAAAVQDADCVILATPVNAIIETLHALPQTMAGEAVIIDTGSTKGLIVDAMSRLPPRMQAVGGHPMTGALTSGAAEPSARLFEGRRFVLTPAASTRPETMAWARTLVADLRAQAVEMDAAQHDAAVALVSHLPYLLPVPLLEMLEQSDPSVQTLAAGGLAARVRGAGANVAMWHDILRTNRRAIAARLAAYGERLRVLESLLLEGSDDELGGMLTRAAQAADAINRRT